ERRELEDDQSVAPGEKARPGAAEIESFTLLGPDGGSTAHLTAGDHVVFRVEVRFDEAVDDPAVGFNISTERGVPVYTENTLFQPSGHFAAGDRLVLEVALEARLTTGSFSSVV